MSPRALAITGCTLVFLATLLGGIQLADGGVKAFISNAPLMAAFFTALAIGVLMILAWVWHLKDLFLKLLFTFGLLALPLLAIGFAIAKG